MRSSHPEVAFALLLALLFGIATFPSLFSSETTALYRDLLFFFLPFKHFLAEHLRSGELPLWNPWLYLGTPFLASLLTGVLYPPSLLLLIPFPLGLNLFFVFHYAVALTGAFGFLRSRGLSAPAAAIGALCYALGGYLVSSLNVTSHLQSAAWTPWVLWCIGRLLERVSARRIAALAVVVALEILGGAPEIVLLTAAIAGGVTVSGVVYRRGGKLAAISALGAALALAVALCACQVLPTAELLNQSTRAGGLPYEEISYWSLHPVSLLQLLLPHSNALVSPGERGMLGAHLESTAPWLMSIYVGLIPLSFAIVGAVRGRDRSGWLAAIAIGALLALGLHTPVLRFLYDHAPGLIVRFRYPEKLWFLVHASVTVLAAEGAQRVLDGDRRSRGALVAAAGTFVALAAALQAVRWLAPLELVRGVAILRGLDEQSFLSATGIASDVVFKSERLLLILSALLAVTLCHAKRWISPSVYAWILLLLAGADLCSAHRDLNLTIRWQDLQSVEPVVSVDELRSHRWRVYQAQTRLAAPPSRPAQPIQGFDYLREPLPPGQPLDRVAVKRWQTLLANVPMMYSVGSFGGFEGIVRSAVSFIHDVLVPLPRAKGVELLRLFSVREIVTTDQLDVPSLSLVRERDGYRVYRIPEPMPPVYLVRRLRTAASDVDAVNAIIAGGFAAGREAVVTTLPAGWTDAETPGAGGTARIDREGSGFVEVITTAATPAFLVLNDSFDPAWAATIDGNPETVLRTNVLVRGLPVPAGERRIRFEYRPRSFYVGSIVSAAALVIVFGLVFLRPRRGES